MNHFLTSWKSTTQSILTVLLSIAGLIALAKTNPTQVPEAVLALIAIMPPKLVFWAGAIGTVAKVWIGVQTQDADKALATTPSNPEPHAVAASPTPLDPSATAVDASKV